MENTTVLTGLNQPEASSICPQDDTGLADESLLEDCLPQARRSGCSATWTPQRLLRAKQVAPLRSNRPPVSQQLPGIYLMLVPEFLHQSVLWCSWLSLLSNTLLMQRSSTGGPRFEPGRNHCFAFAEPNKETSIVLSKMVFFGSFNHHMANLGFVRGAKLLISIRQGITFLHLSYSHEATV